MTFAEDFQRGWSAGRGGSPARPASGRPGSPKRETPAGGNPARKPSSIRLGHYLDRKTGECSDTPLLMTSPLHTLVVGVNGAGKQTRFLTELYMTTSARALFVF